MGYARHHHGDHTVETLEEREKRLDAVVKNVRKKPHPRLSVMLDETDLPYHGE